MSSNNQESAKEVNSPTTIEPSSVEKKIGEYLNRNTPRDANLLKSAKTLINNLHPKGIVHPETDYRDCGEDARRILSDSDTAKDLIDSLESSQTLIDRYTKLIKENDFLKKELEKKDGDMAAPGSQSLVDRYTRLIKENEVLKKELEKKQMDLHELGPQSLIDRYTKLIKENEFLKKELEKKEMDFNALGPRYKYMEKHFDDFIRMKDEYERLKEDKIRNGKFTETQHKAQQTWASSVICESCVKTLDIVQSPEFQRFLACKQDDAYCVTKSELMDLEEKFKALKESIAQREREYENRFEKAEIIHLTALNCKYRSQITDLHKKNKQNHNWANALQRIIAKICARDELGELTDQEQGWVERIVEKYLSIEEAAKENTKESTSRESLPTSDHQGER